MTGKENDQERERKRKGRIAKGYLGLQGIWHEREAMGKGKGTLLGGEVVEGNCRRNGDNSINSAV